MIGKYLLLSFLLTLTLGACVRSVSPSPVATVAPSPLATAQTAAGVYLVYQRSGGLTGAHETWFIDRQGQVTQPDSNATLQLTAAQLSELTAAVNAANFMTLQDSYLPKDLCCDRYEHTITLTLDGQSKSVQTIDASPTAPSELTNLVNLLGKLVTVPSPATQ